MNSPLPLTLGSDLSGVAESTGPGVTQWKPGNEIYGVTNPEFIGAYAEFALASSNMIPRKPKGLSFTEAASGGSAPPSERFEEVTPMVDVVLDMVGGDALQGRLSGWTDNGPVQPRKAAPGSGHSASAGTGARRARHAEWCAARAGKNRLERRGWDFPVRE